MNQPLFCLYCFEREFKKHHKAHIFKESIGGRVFFDNCCDKCNHALGHGIEADLERCTFFAFGKVATGIADRESAFRQIRITDPKTGERYQYQGDRLFGTPKIRGKHTRIAPPGLLEQLAFRDVKKRFPNEAEHYRNQLKNGSKRILVGNEEHIFYLEHLTGPIEFEGKVAFPIRVLAKLAYEGMFATGLFTNDSMRDFYASTFQVFAKDNGSRRIEVSKSFMKRVCTVSPSPLDKPDDLPNVKYKKSHSMDFRVTKSNIAYVKIQFFEVLSFIVAIGLINQKKIVNRAQLNKRFFFPFSGPKMVARNFPRRFRHRRQFDDALAHSMWKRYSSEKDSDI